MKIVMLLEKNLIDSVKIEKDKITYPGYLSGCVKHLKEKHRHLLFRSVIEPEFLLFSFNASMATVKDQIQQLNLPFNLTIKT